MAEGVGCAAEGWGLQDRDLLAHLAQQRHAIAGVLGLGVQTHVEERELDLAQGLQTALEVFGRQHLVEQRARQGLASVHVGGHVAQHAPLPAEVLHELAGQFHRVPLHAADARDVALVDLREHVVQAVAAFVEEGDHVVVREQRGLAVDALAEVAHQVRHRRLQLAAVGAQPTGAHIVHPCAAAFARAGAGVEVKLAHQGALALDAVELHRGVPHRGAVAANAHLKQGLDDFEQTGQDLGRGEIGFDLLVAEGVTRFLEFLAHIRPVPSLRVAQAQVFGRESAHLGHVAFGVGSGALGQVAQKAHHLVGRLRHLGGQRHLREVLVTQELRFLLAQGQDLADQSAVVQTGVAALVGGAGDVGAVERLTHGAVLRKLHDRQIARHFQVELVARLAFGLSGRSRGGEHVLGHAVELIAFHIQSKPVGRVERVFAEFL